MLDVRKSRELQATIFALRQAERGIRLSINKTARSRISPLWKAEINARARTSIQREVIASGARATASDRGVTFYAATKTRPLSGGLVPSYQWAGAEFGARSRVVEVTQKSRRGTSYTRPLTINRQFTGRQQEGMVAFDAASDTGTRLVALWVYDVVAELGRLPGAEVVS